MNLWVNILSDFVFPSAILAIVFIIAIVGLILVRYKRKRSAVEDSQIQIELDEGKI